MRMSAILAVCQRPSVRQSQSCIAGAWIMGLGVLTPENM